MGLNVETDYLELSDLRKLCALKFFFPFTAKANSKTMLVFSLVNM